MGDLIKKQKDQIKILLAERFKLRQEIESIKKKSTEINFVHPEYERLKEANKIMEAKMRQVMEDISQKVAETSLAKSELANTKRDLEAAHRDIGVLKESEIRYLKLLTKKEQKIEELDNDGLKQTRERLRKRGEELETMNRKALDLQQKLNEANRKINYLESNAKLSDQKAV